MWTARSREKSLSVKRSLPTTSKIVVQKKPVPLFETSWLYLGCPLNKQKFGSNQNKPKQDLFWLCFRLFRETKNKKIGLFRCFEPMSKQPKQTELFQNNPKQPKIFWKISKYALYQTVLVGLLFVLVQSKQSKLSVLL